MKKAMELDYAQIGKIEAMLTSLKLDSNIDQDPFGNSVADKQIKAVLETLKIGCARCTFEAPDFKARIILEN